MKYRITFDFYPNELDEHALNYKKGDRVILMSTENTNTREMWYWLEDDEGQGFPLFCTNNVRRYHGFAGSFNQYAYHIHGSRYIRECERRYDEVGRPYLHVTLGPDTRPNED